MKFLLGYNMKIVIKGEWTFGGGDKNLWWGIFSEGGGNG